ncbi:MAG: hypothetical protein JWO22_3406 [Frankiales bacterium]|nr:hypothetical protein [Frankiales bacterium]
MTEPLGTAADRRSEGPDKVPCRVCDHPKDAHEHHRRGTDCSQSGCECAAWRRPHGKLLGLFSR